MTEVEEYFEQLDRDTVLRLGFQGHCDQYLYRFPSGDMVLKWGDPSLSGKIARMNEEHCRECVEESHEIKGTVPFEESPFAEGWEDIWREKEGLEDD